MFPRLVESTEKENKIHKIGLNLGEHHEQVVMLNVLFSYSISLRIMR